MSQLAECRTCGEPVSTNATTCPHCGEPYPTHSVTCPSCGSDELAVHGRKGFSTGKALVGAILVGPLGAAAGGMGHQNIRLTCSKCGYAWEESPEKLQAKLTGKTVLEKGQTLDGTILSIEKFVLNPEHSMKVDLGDGNFGTVYLETFFSNINKKRRKIGLAAFQAGDSVTVQITDNPLPGNLGVQLGYKLAFVDPLQVLEREIRK